MNNNKGFTLIEMVVVIVILGILAVNAAPRFLNIQEDARVSVLEGAKGAIAAANEIVYGKSAIEGEEGAQVAAVMYHGNTINTTYGNIMASEPPSITNSTSIDFNVTGMKYSAIAPNGKKFEALGSGIYLGDELFNGNDVEETKCFLFATNVPYDQPTVAMHKGDLVFSMETAGC